MNIRFTKMKLLGNIQLLPGEHLEFPDAVAQQHIDDGNAVEVPAAEHAVRLPGHEFAFARPAAVKASAAKKSAAKKAAASK